MSKKARLAKKLRRKMKSVLRETNFEQELQEQFESILLRGYYVAIEN